jgi:hypothetical protein
MKAFFDAIRPMFGGAMTQAQVSGCETLLAATASMPIMHRAYLLATSYHETAQTMQPITEYGQQSYFNKYEPGTRIGKALGNTQPGDGYRYRGRGYVQITGRANYAKAGAKLGVDLIGNPEAALNPDLAARILVRGCTEGWFTGKKLSDYSDYVNMRRVVNGTDRAEMIAGYAETFEAALLMSVDVAASPAPDPVIKPAVEVPAPTGWAAIIAAIMRLFQGANK